MAVCASSPPPTFCCSALLRTTNEPQGVTLWRCGCGRRCGVWVGMCVCAGVGADWLPGNPGWAALHQVFSLLDGALLSESLVNVTRCMLAFSHCMGPYPSGDCWGVGVNVGTDGKSRQALVRNVAMARPEAPLPWHLSASKSEGRYLSPAAMLSQYQLPTAVRSSAAAPEAPAFVDPFDAVAEVYGAPAWVATACCGSAAASTLVGGAPAVDNPYPDALSPRQVAYLLLKSVDDMCSVAANRALVGGRAPGSSQTAPTVMACPATFSILRRLIGTAVEALAAGDTADAPGVELTLYGGLVALRTLRYIVVTPKFVGVLSNAVGILQAGFDVGTVARASAGPADEAVGVLESPCTARFISQLKWLVEARVSGTAPCAFLPDLVQVAVDCMTLGLRVFCPTADEQVRLLGSLVAHCLKHAAVAGGAAAAVGVPGDKDSQTRALLLHRYFRSVCEPRHVVAMLPMGASNGASQEVKALLENGLLLIVQQTETQVGARCSCALLQGV
jgi:hypothetical protein